MYFVVGSALHVSAKISGGQPPDPPMPHRKSVLEPPLRSTLRVLSTLQTKCMYALINKDMKNIPEAAVQSVQTELRTISSCSLMCTSTVYAFLCILCSGVIFAFTIHNCPSRFNWTQLIALSPYFSVDDLKCGHYYNFLKCQTVLKTIKLNSFQI